MANTAKQLSLATEHLRAGNLTRARSLYRRIVSGDPKHAEAWYLLGLTAAEAGCDEQAAMLIAKAIGLAGPVAHYCANLGRLLLRSGRPREAAACLRQALAGEPLNARIAIELACALVETGDRQDAVLALQHAADLEPTSPAIAFQLGHQLRGLGRSEEAIYHYRAAAALAPASRDAKLALASALFEAGQWDEGFTLVRSADASYGPIPAWDGSPLAGKRILLRAEEPLEDALQLIRYAPLVREQGATVIVECSAPLASLLRDAGGVDEVAGPGGAAAADVQSSLTGLAGIFGTLPDRIPAETPYLLAEHTRAEHWRAALNAAAGVRALRVGVACPARQLAAFAEVAGVEFFNLESSPQPDAALTPRPLGEQCADLADLAAAMVNLDLVIAADGPAAHLAGALDVPVWTMLADNPHWRWAGATTATSAWYPSMRLIRPAEAENAAADLALLANARASR